MNITLWIIASVLAAAFFASGLMKAVQPREKLMASNMGWAEDFSAGAVKAIGAAEVLGALGLVLPAALDVAPALVPWAAAGLAVTMLGAVVVHVRRNEYRMALPGLVLLVLAVVVAWGRFGPCAF
ncbi:DoxX family protein [Streptomyces sp. JH14]|uniref:DoxX family protein n=1 Tax=Streptomyces sp. JH14 TaxID=2793630 RepID=UPI0023F8F8B0|nr:DoxX family protein [Streptomyces sp. JH14]MDF6041877.1 DoxX family protein [Streptomyces sp. JH14]